MTTNAQRNTLRLTDLDAWIVKRLLSGVRVGPDEPGLSSFGFELLSQISQINPAWREQTLKSSLTQDELALIDAANPNGRPPAAPAPIRIQPAQEPVAPATTYRQPAIQQPLLTLEDLRNLPKPEIALPGLYPFYLGCLNMLVGASGVGKSFVALDFLLRVTQHAPTIYVVGEGLSGYPDRVDALTDFNKWKTSGLYFYTPMQLTAQAERGAFTELALQVKPAFIVIDTLARAAVGLEENSARDMGVFIDACQQMIFELGCGLLLVHHAGKDGKLRGSSSLYAACDSVVFQSRSDNRIKLCNDMPGGGKNKHSEELSTRYLVLKKHLNSAVAASAAREDQEMTEGDVYDKPPKGTQLEILKSLEGHPYGLKVKDIAGVTGVAQSSLYNSLITLVKGGLVVQNAQGYALTDAGIRKLRFQ